MTKDGAKAIFFRVPCSVSPLDPRKILACCAPPKHRCGRIPAKEATSRPRMGQSTAVGDVPQLAWNHHHPCCWWLLLWLGIPLCFYLRDPSRQWTKVRPKAFLLRSLRSFWDPQTSQATCLLWHCGGGLALLRARWSRPRAGKRFCSAMEGMR